jgi:Mn2+/Fe2+ NRAMP family transporter
LSRPHDGRAHPPTKPLSFRKRLLGLVGPGFIAGASDDDPSGIATYSQVGAQFGYGLLWTIPFSFPLMTAIQDISARIERDLEEGLEETFPASDPVAITDPVVDVVKGDKNK